MTSTTADRQESTGSADSASSDDGNIHTTRRDDRTSFMKLLQSMTKPVMTRMPPPKKEYPPGSPQLEPHKVAKKHCNVHERVIEDIYIYDLTPKDSEPKSGEGQTRRTNKQLYYFAGGSWRMPPSKEHWALCAEMAVQLPDTQISIVSHPLAPNSPAPETFPQLTRMYRALLHEATSAGEEVILAGDSSGGEIILCLTGNAIPEDPNAPAPAALVAICPSVDLRQSNLEQLDVEPNDPILRIVSSRDHADKWRGSWTAVDSRINPLYIDWEPVARKGVKVHGVVGGHDILRPDAIKLRDNLNEAGVAGEWLDWGKQMHGYPLTFSYGLEEGKEAKNWIVDVLRQS